LEVRTTKRKLTMEKQTQKTSAVIFVGYKTELSYCHRDIRPEFQAPKNVVKEETRAKKIAEKEEEYEREASGYVHAGQIAEIAVFDPCGGMDERCDAGGFVRSFNQEYGDRFDEEGQPIDGAVRFVGSGIRTFVKMLWAQQANLLLGAKLAALWVGNDCQLPPGMLHTTHVDVDDILVPSGFKACLDVDKILKEHYSAAPFGSDPLEDARVAGTIALAYNLYPQFHDDIARLFDIEEVAC
jgi:hypothetical protein